MLKIKEWIEKRNIIHKKMKRHEMKMFIFPLFLRGKNKRYFIPAKFSSEFFMLYFIQKFQEFLYFSKKRLENSKKFQKKSKKFLEISRNW